MKSSLNEKQVNQFPHNPRSLFSLIFPPYSDTCAQSYILNQTHTHANARLHAPEAWPAHLIRVIRVIRVNKAWPTWASLSRTARIEKTQTDSCELTQERGPAIGSELPQHPALRLDN